jgi:hypothetical protein
MLQHDRYRLAGKLPMSLQKAIEAPEPAGLLLVSESSGAHQCDMVAHQTSQNAAEWRALP